MQWRKQFTASRAIVQSIVCLLGTTFFHINLTFDNILVFTLNYEVIYRTVIRVQSGVNKWLKNNVSRYDNSLKRGK